MLMSYSVAAGITGITAAYLLVNEGLEGHCYRSRKSVERNNRSNT